MDARQAAALAVDRFGATFPFAAGVGRLEKGRTVNLAGPLGVPAPVHVEDITPTSFTFRALPGHPEGEGRRITFSFADRGKGARLDVKASGPSSTTAQLTVRSGLAQKFWSDYAANLSAAIRARKPARQR